MLAWLRKRERDLKFPTKTGVNTVACVSLLDLYGSLFCLDNHNILFYKDGVPKVLRPVKEQPANPKYEYTDYDAFIEDDYFVIRCQNVDYYYHAQFEVVQTFNNVYIKLLDIKQPIFDTQDEDGDLRIQTN